MDIEVPQSALRRRVDDKPVRADPALWTQTAAEWAEAATTKPGSYMRAATFAECKRSWVRRRELFADAAASGRGG